MNKILHILKIDNINPKIKTIMSIGIKCSFVLLLFSVLILSIYLNNTTNFIYILGTSLFKSSSMFMVAFFINGICFDKIIKDKNFIN